MQINPGGRLNTEDVIGRDDEIARYWRVIERQGLAGRAGLEQPQARLSVSGAAIRILPRPHRLTATDTLSQTAYSAQSAQPECRTTVSSHRDLRRSHLLRSAPTQRQRCRCG